MGSRQSSESGGSFSVDPNGNITKESPTKLYTSSSTTTTTKQASDQTKPKDITEQQYASDVNKNSDNYNDHLQAPASPIDEAQSLTISSSPQISKSTMTNSLNIEEADVILSNMKKKYKPNSQEMTGKQQSVFEQIERELIQCYSINKHQPLNCEKLSQNYQTYVNQQRNKVLSSKTNINNVPLITTVLVIFTCLLLHITTVSCYGAMSIDLGSEWMKVGLVAPNVQMDIVLNAQSQRKTSMAIAFLNGERYIGDTALDIASKYPEKTYTHFLDLVGKEIEHESVKNYLKRFPYANITSHEPNSTSILLNHPEGLNFTPLELIAMMIQHAHDQVTTRLDSNEPAYDVVITVPPFFNQTERRVIEDAAKLVGLNVLRLTNVNSAFALSYGIYRHKDYLPETTTSENETTTSGNKTTILFFDQGASQTSASLADYHLVEQFDEITGVSKNESLPTVSIRAQVYDRYLGGFDMQLKLRDHLVEAFAKSTKIDKTRIFKRGRSSSKLLKESGRVKKVLSANSDHVVRVENVIDDKDLKLPITRQQFEELNQEYLGDRITNLLDKLFEMPNVNKDEKLESVIIVGGNTRTPKIQQVLLDYFKLDSLGKSINADEGAALATLYQAASLGRGFRVKKFVLEEFDPTDAPFSIYSDFELSRMGENLSRLQEQDFMRLQRLTMRNNLESLLSEGKEKLSDKKLILETYTWLEEASQSELDNITLLADKFNAVQKLVRPLPPPPPPPQTQPQTQPQPQPQPQPQAPELDPFASSPESSNVTTVEAPFNSTASISSNNTISPDEVKSGPAHSEL